MHRKPRELSGGQQQRVALGRALVREPVAFLFDEPLSNLDAKLRASMRTELIKLHLELGTTIIHVTHDQVEAMTMGQRICIMRDGHIIQVGAPLEVYRNPVDTFVAGFLASPPMNLLDARLTNDDDAMTVDLEGLRLPVPDDLRAGFAALIDKSVVFGIRPEDVYADAGPGGRTPLDVQVVALEALGPEVVLVSRLPSGKEISTRMGRSYTAAIGSTVRLHADMGMMHLFDPATGRSAMATRT